MGTKRVALIHLSQKIRQKNLPYLNAYLFFFSREFQTLHANRCDPLIVTVPAPLDILARSKTLISGQNIIWKISCARTVIYWERKRLCFLKNYAQPRKEMEVDDKGDLIGLTWNHRLTIFLPSAIPELLWILKRHWLNCNNREIILHTAVS